MLIQCSTTIVEVDLGDKMFLLQAPIPPQSFLALRSSSVPESWRERWRRNSNYSLRNNLSTSKKLIALWSTSKLIVGVVISEDYSIDFSFCEKDSVHRSREHETGAKKLRREQNPASLAEKKRLLEYEARIFLASTPLATGSQYQAKIANTRSRSDQL